MMLSSGICIRYNINYYEADSVTILDVGFFFYTTINLMVKLKSEIYICV